MKKRWIFTGLILSLLLLLVLSNPTKNKYVEWVNDKAQCANGHPTTKMMDQLLLPKKIFEGTERRNLIFLSLYKTVGDGETVMRTVGIFNNYIVLQSNF